MRDMGKGLPGAGILSLIFVANVCEILLVQPERTANGRPYIPLFISLLL